ncbi:GNAT family N-acetyltransferase [Anaerobacillus isosaccharinicus]|uniref:GNAT family N-acetyltransferase n=1 Tax=Anaerobacillus isosaccharinicus TaxID=1532552 RepID=A0A1S2KYN7_9BACI|nr:GNAT family N-acetyltransferase [Anaerobacillus isosaccharinicus]MBA5586867.1 GNAT family N-acetyltransferase [Anaerobacillus isosaccharinicus]QOY34922.1 GNAT family N-acetyltransferase [Anaerobacillus isosaccharinicus]
MNTNLIFYRKATKEDLVTIVQMLSDDDLGKNREQFEYPLPESYYDAFRSIDSDPNIELTLAYYEDKIVGVLQIVFTPYITYQGGWRATIEGVRTASFLRGKGIGKQLIQWAITRAKERNCHIVQLTTDKNRKDAIRFYEQLGFKPTHEGFKMHL